MSCLDTVELPCAISGSYWGGMTLTFETSTDGTTYTPIDITGFNVKITWSAIGGGFTPEVWDVAGGEISLTDPTNGIAVVNPVNSIAFTKGEYIGRVEYITAGKTYPYGFIKWEIE